MSKSIFVLGLALSSFLALSGCASIVSHSDWPVMINSNPQGALVKILDEDGHVVDEGLTPLACELSSKEGYFSKADYQVEATLAGYPTTKKKLSAKINGWYWGNILFGGLIGFFIVDPATGAMWKLRDDFTVSLVTPTP